MLAVLAACTLLGLGGPTHPVPRLRRRAWCSRHRVALIELCPTRHELHVLPLLQPTLKEIQMLMAVNKGDLAAVQALLGRDRALTCTTDLVRCSSALANLSSVLPWAHCILRALFGKRIHLETADGLCF